MPAFLHFDPFEAYVVDRGFTSIPVAGTTVPLPVYVQPTSFPPAEIGVQAGRFGATCCVSVKVGTLM